MASRNQSENDTRTSYVYRDFSHVPDDGTRDIKISKNVSTQRLPIKLYAMLSKPEFSHIITWMPHGRSWIILDPKALLREVSPLYFENCNYSSFIRLVNAWGFRRMKTGRDQNSYYHELFLRGLPHLHRLMRRLKKDEKKAPLDEGKEPDFYKISERYPLLISKLTAKESPQLNSSVSRLTSGYFNQKNPFISHHFPLANNLKEPEKKENLGIPSRTVTGRSDFIPYERGLTPNNATYEVQNRRFMELYFLKKAIEARRLLLQSLP